VENGDPVIRVLARTDSEEETYVALFFSTTRLLSACGGRKLPLNGKALTVACDTVGLVFSTTHFTPSVHGGVVREPE